MSEKDIKQEIVIKEKIKTEVETFTRKVKVPDYLKPEIVPIRKQEEKKVEEVKDDGS